MQVTVSSNTGIAAKQGSAYVIWTDEPGEQCNINVQGYVIQISDSNLRAIYEALDFLYGQHRAE